MNLPVRQYENIDEVSPEKPLDLSVEQVTYLTHAYMNTGQSAADIGVAIGVPTPVVRTALKQFGLVQAKKDAIAEARQREQAAYVDFLVANRVPTAQKHLEISNQLVDIVGKLTSKVGDPEADGFADACEDLKKAVGTLRTLSEILEKSSGVGAKAVSLSGMQDSPNFATAPEAAGGRRPLVTFNIGAGAARPSVDFIEG